MSALSQTSPQSSGVRRLDPQLLAALVAGAALVGWQGLTWIGDSSGVPVEVVTALVWISFCAGAVFGVRAAWDAVKRFRLDIDILMVVGAGLSAYIGHPAEGALLLFMFTLAGALEHRAMARAKDAVSRLMKLMPTTAWVRDASASTGWSERPADALIPGDEVLIKPGETVPADGLVTSGHSELDTSSLTGESLPRPAGVGDEVFAGTVNQSGSLEVRVTRAVHDSSIKRIIALVTEAQERRQQVQRLIDRLSTPYTACVFLAAILALGWFMWGERLGWEKSAYSAITLLIVASPCALVIATPTATLCGLSRAARSGLLVKGGDALERLATVRAIALDKTGTLTLGRIGVTRAEAFGAPADPLAGVAAGVESHSTHPIASAIVAWAGTRGIAPAPVTGVRNVPGRGIEALRDGKPVRVGRAEWAGELLDTALLARVEAWLNAARQTGELTALCAAPSCGGALAIALADSPRPGARGLASRLRRAGVGRVVMLTGDHRVIADKVAAEVGITEVHAGLLPEQKVEHLRAIKAQAGTGLALVGDGVNDAPGLAVADVGLAMGGIGAGAALEAADVVVLHDDLNRIPWAFELARRVRLVMAINLTIAVGVIVVLASLTLGRFVPLGLGVVGHEGSTLLVVAISLTILGFRGPGVSGSADQS